MWNILEGGFAAATSLFLCFIFGYKIWKVSPVKWGYLSFQLCYGILKGSIQQK